jgi:hypothetical protein
VTLGVTLTLVSVEPPAVGALSMVAVSAVAVSPPLRNAASRPVTAQDVSVADAELAAHDASDARVTAEDHLADVQAVANTLDQQLAHMNEHDQDIAARLALAQEQARRLAVDAYIQGAGVDDLRDLVGPQQATDAAWRRHLTIGRVDQAREAAASLDALRGAVDDRLADLVGRATAARQDVLDAESDLRQAEANESFAYEQLAGARRAEAVAQEAEASAAAARSAREAEASAARSSPSSSSSAGSSSSSSAGPSAAGSSAGGPSAGEPPSSGGGTSPATEAPTVPRTSASSDPWEYLRQCESGGNYQAVSANGLYRGAYQFAQATWEGVGGVGDPAAAPPSEQDARARALYERAGSSAWPYCGRYLS